MHYMLVNTSLGSLQINLFDPNPKYNKTNLHRPGPILALSIGRGSAVDILPHFNNVVEDAYESLKFSKDALKYIRENKLVAYVCDDNNKKIDIDALLSKKVKYVEEPVNEQPEVEEPVKEQPEVEEPVKEQSEVVEKSSLKKAKKAKKVKKIKLQK